MNISWQTKVYSEKLSNSSFIAISLLLLSFFVSGIILKNYLFSFFSFVAFLLIFLIHNQKESTLKISFKEDGIQIGHRFLKKEHIKQFTFSNKNGKEVLIIASVNPIFSYLELEYPIFLKNDIEESLLNWGVEKQKNIEEPIYSKIANILFQ